MRHSDSRPVITQITRKVAEQRNRLKEKFLDQSTNDQRNQPLPTEGPKKLIIEDQSIINFAGSPPTQPMSG
jgi:hypothetical protein